MSDDTAALADRIEDDASRSSLSPAVATVVGDVLEPGAHSLTLALTRASATTVAGADTHASDPGAKRIPGLLEVCTALVRLGGYARLRGASVRDVRSVSRAEESEGAPERADAESTITLLASDFLHASAHRTLGEAPVPPARKATLYRTLTRGSADLAAAFTDSKGGPESDAAGDRNGEPAEGPTAVLAGTGCALGAVVAGATRETVDAMGTYGRSLVDATERLDQDGRLLATLEAVVDGRATTGVAGDGDEQPRIERVDSAVVARALERATAALDDLPETPGRRRLERALLVPVRGVSERH